MAAHPRAPRFGFTLVELLVVIAIIGVMVGLLLPAVQAAREAARRMQCSNNLRQIGLALHNYEATHKRYPSGWHSDRLNGEPGWGWATALMPFIEQNNVHDRITSHLEIIAPENEPVLRQVVATFICPSDPGDTTFEIAEAEDDHGHFQHRLFAGNLPFAAEDDDDHDDDHEPHNVDEGHKLFRIAKCNYVGMFGTSEVDESPYLGDGVFFGNSQVRLRDIIDGTSNTLVIGERGSRLGGSLWHGVIPEANAPYARTVGSADHVPNSPAGHFDDFSSFHPGGAYFVLADNSVRMIPDSIDLDVYRAMATRQGGEVVQFAQ